MLMEKFELIVVRISITKDFFLECNNFVSLEENLRTFFFFVLNNISLRFLLKKKNRNWIQTGSVADKFLILYRI